MSTRSLRQPNSQRDIEGALSPHIQVDEKDTYRIEEYPSDIVQQLKRAAFQKDTAGTYIKRVRAANADSGAKVVTVEVGNDELVIETEDVVGIVNLTPNATLQINPKIGWSEILEMFLEVSEQRRSLEYQGIPIRDFLADDIGIEDVFIVVALNYLESLEDIFRHGFIRSFDRERSQGLQGRGRIDIERSLKNFDLPDGVPKHEFVQKTVEYGIPVNDMIYTAGVELRRLFHLYASESPTAGYTQIFSRLERALSRLEQQGITGESVRLADIPSITYEDIPRQRNYYTDALQISKTILSSAIGQPLDEGRERLLMEYIIGMDSLFESYAALVLDEEIDRLRDISVTGGFEEIEAEKRSYRLFKDENLTQRVQPDHILLDAGTPVAVLDSKYYAESKSPLDGSWARSRLLSYGYRLETDCLGMIAPLADQGRYELKGRSGAIHVIAPEGGSFSTHGFRTAVREFLMDEFGTSDELSIHDMLTSHVVCHPDISANSQEECLAESALNPESLEGKSREILKYATKKERLSEEVNPRGTEYLRHLNDFREYIRKELVSYDIAVPFYISTSDDEAERIRSTLDGPEGEGPDEFIEFHCFCKDDSGIVMEYEIPTPFSISW